MTHANAARSQNQHPELGRVAWFRDYDDALQESESTGKPILLQFQEVPGCSTCVNFGAEVLSHPLMVEIIEEKFVPLAIFNNKPGRDAEILRQFNELAWNNPVTYFLDKYGNNIVPKLANSYRPLSMYNKIREVLLKTEGALPEYFKLLEGDIKIDNSYAEKVYFETPCFWSGETTMAQHPAVISSEAGWIGHKEVVEIYFDSEIAALADLKKYALKEGFFMVENGNYRTDKEPQYYLRKTPFKYLPLSRAQRTKINRAIPYREDPESFLSPRQLNWLKHLPTNAVGEVEMYRKDIATAWKIKDKKI